MSVTERLDIVHNFAAVLDPSGPRRSRKPFVWLLLQRRFGFYREQTTDPEGVPMSVTERLDIVHNFAAVLDPGGSRRVKLLPTRFARGGRGSPA
jgi:hypothetical protein